MLESRDLKRDLAALALAAAAIFLILSWTTHDPADPPHPLDYPVRAEIANFCGLAGSAVSSWLLAGLGQVGTVYLLFSALALSAALFIRAQITEPVGRMLGWTLSLIGMTSLAAIAMPGWSGSGLLGPGGYLGATFRALLVMHFATAGAYILAVLLVACGLLLCTDYTLIRWTVWLCAAPTRRVAVLAELIRRARRHGVEDEYEETDEEEDEEEELPTVKIRSRKQAREEEEELEDEEESPEDEAEDEEEDAPAPGVAARLAGAFRIKKRGPRSDDPHAIVRRQLDAASIAGESSDFELPSIELLERGETEYGEEHEKEIRRYARLLEKTFQSFGLTVKVVEIETGPVISQYEVELEAGLRLSKITGLSDDLAIALRVPSVRIVAPIPGKNTVGIEIPNSTRQLVRLRDVIEQAATETSKYRIPVYLGKDVSGNALVVDLTTLPHLLIAGRTGTGKSVCLNSIIASMLMTRRPDEVRMLMIDPKMVELSPYKSLPHLMHPVVTDMHKAEAILGWAVEKMEERYALLARAGVRHVGAYNQLGEDELMNRLSPESDDERAQIPKQLPYIVIVADEMADLMMTAPKEVEHHIIRLAQKSRAVGIHLVLATQKPTVDVITGLIKSNLPARISFQVASRVDSRVVLDENGADKLLGNGDMLFLYPGTNSLLRGQGTYVSDEEINKVVDFVSTDEPCFVKELVQLKPKPSSGKGGKEQWTNRDDMYPQAVEIVLREGRGSLSLLQRALGIGYGRAARLIDYMAEDGIVGQYNGSQAREILITMDDWQRMMNGDGGDDGGGGPELKPSKPGRHGSNPDAGDSAAEPRTKLTTKAAHTKNARHVIEEEEAPWEDELDDEEANGEEEEWEEDETEEVDDEADYEEEELDDEEYDEDDTAEDDTDEEEGDEDEEATDEYEEDEYEEDEYTEEEADAEDEGLVEEEAEEDADEEDSAEEETDEVDEAEEHDNATEDADDEVTEEKPKRASGKKPGSREDKSPPPFDKRKGPRIIRRDERRDRLQSLQQRLNRFPHGAQDKTTRRFKKT